MQQSRSREIVFLISAVLLILLGLEGVLFPATPQPTTQTLPGAKKSSASFSSNLHFPSNPHSSVACLLVSGNTQPINLSGTYTFASKDWSGRQNFRNGKNCITGSPGFWMIAPCPPVPGTGPYYTSVSMMPTSHSWLGHGSYAGKSISISNCPR